MVFLWVADAGGGGFIPVQHGCGALIAGHGHGVRQPSIESGGGGFGTGAEQAQVMVAETAANDQHAFVAQRGYGATQSEMGGGS